MPNTFPDWLSASWRNPETGMVRVMRTIDIRSGELCYRCDVLVNPTDRDTVQLHWDFEEPMESDQIKSRVRDYLHEKFPDGYEPVLWHHDGLSKYGWCVLL